ncbi:phosphomevalonate kinase [Microthyrium microscopicum]|uniref:Phosphomevalonate kinase n=1 Tax=Microthyrium microscopicum TaxID=703497 RepID=A0A6A6U719_9PEZI|nr:phosphomevalonate kinase [Microthyrium microscopicum]
MPSDDQSRKTVAVSAPGKVLLAGGYLVLDRDYTGLVFGLDARIHVHIRPLHTSTGVVLEEIIVKSPQFKDAIWEYGYRRSEKDGGVLVHPLTSSAQQTLHPNPFVETTLTHVLTYISTKLASATNPSPTIHPSAITILADDAYYTTPSNKSTEFTGEQFKFFGIPLWDAHKTGLGSSAALVTALTAALLAHYLPEEKLLTTEEGRLRVHNLAQVAHCVAQGKVGSGFDVASAVYGSCIYRRFSPSVIAMTDSPGTAGYASRLRALVDDDEAIAEDKEEGEGQRKKWDTQITKAGAALPKGLRLVMCDVDCGSKTPGMVKGVLDWRKREPEEAGMVWTKLHAQNEAVQAELQHLCQADAKAEFSGRFDKLSAALADVRASVRNMSRLSGVPIEPESQRALLDGCLGVTGVVNGVVPGAGGYDAVALLIEDTPETLEELRKFLERWNTSVAAEQAQLAKASGVEWEEAPGLVSVLEVKQDDEGVRVEKGAMYASWVLRREESNDDYEP